MLLRDYLADDLPVELELHPHPLYFETREEYICNYCCRRFYTTESYHCRLNHKRKPREIKNEEWILIGDKWRCHKLSKELKEQIEIEEKEECERYNKNLLEERKLGKKKKCDFDLCVVCFNQFFEKQQYKNINKIKLQKPSFFIIKSIHKHPLKYRKVTEKWECNDCGKWYENAYDFYCPQCEGAEQYDICEDCFMKHEPKELPKYMDDNLKKIYGCCCFPDKEDTEKYSGCHCNCCAPGCCQECVEGAFCDNCCEDKFEVNKKV